MSRARWIAATLIVIALAALLGWQWRREGLISACHAAGGHWQGRTSLCVKPPPRPILKRDIERG